MQAPTEAILSHAHSSPIGLQHSTIQRANTLLSSAAPDPIFGSNTSASSGDINRLLDAVGPEGVAINSQHCSLFAEYSYGKDNRYAERPVVYVVPDMVFNLVKPAQVQQLALANFYKMLAEENLRWLPLDVTPEVELNMQERALEATIARAEAELRVLKPLGGGMWRKGLKNSKP